MTERLTTNEQDVVRDTYEPEEDRSLTDAIVDSIEECKGEDLLRTDFELFEDVDQNALENLVRQDAQPGTRVAITTDDVRIELWGNDGVEIRVEEGRDE